MKNKIVVSIALATLMLVALCAVCVSPLSVSAQNNAAGQSVAVPSTSVQPSIHLAKASVASAPAVVQAPALVGGNVYSAPAVSTDGSGWTQFFVVGSDHALWYRAYNQLTWKSLGGYVTADPASVSQTAGVTDVFVRGIDGALWSKYTTDGGTTWTAWSKLNAQLKAGTGPTAYAWGNQRLGVFVTGMSSTVSQIYVDKWGVHSENIGGTASSSPAATSYEPGRIDVFVRGPYNALWQRTYTEGTGNNWGAWTSLGGTILAGTGPTATSYKSGATVRIDVFVIGMNKHVWWDKWNGVVWSNWDAPTYTHGDLQGQATSSPGAMTFPVGNTVWVFVRGIDYQLWDRSHVGGADTWNAWFRLTTLGPL
jgi:hypothetical protein